MKSLITVLFALFLISCAPIHVNYDYDKQTDFSQYKTYNYFNNIQSGLSALDEKRFIQALDSALQVKGILLSETPDFLIDFKSNEYEDANRNTVGVGVGGGGRNVGGGISIGIPLNSAKLNRQIVIDFVEAINQKLFWQAVSESSFNPNASPEKREERLKTIVEKVLFGYPPKQ